MTTTVERELLEALAGAYTLAELYALVEAAGELVTGRDDGHDVVHGRTDTRWRRRVRGALQQLKRTGRARREGDRVWVLDGTPERPRAVVLVSLSGAQSDVELRVESACELLASFDHAADLVFADSPYALGVGRGQREDTGARVYGRDGDLVVPGYVDVDPDQFRPFTMAWVEAAAGAIRPGGYLAAVTGPQQAAWTQVYAELAGLTYVNQLIVRHPFPLRTTRRLAHAHWTVTIMCKGSLTSARRVFTPPADLPKARSGRDYPLDVWDAGDVGRADARPGEMRYSNSLPLRMVQRIVGMLTPDPTPARRGLMVEPFLGGGTGALAAAQRGIDYVGSDVNPWSVLFSARRLTRELGAGAEARAEAGPVQLALI